MQWCYFFTLLGSTNSFDVCDKYEAWRGLASSFSFPHISVFFVDFCSPETIPFSYYWNLKKMSWHHTISTMCQAQRSLMERNRKRYQQFFFARVWCINGSSMADATDKCFFLYYFISLFVCLSVWFGPWQSGASLSLCPFLSLWSALVREMAHNAFLSTNDWN